MDDRTAKLTAIIIAGLTFSFIIACVYSPISWSPDSSYIAFVRSRGAPGKLEKSREFEIWVVSPDGRTKHRLISTEGHLSAPTWSPKGDKIAYLMSMEEESAEVIILDVKEATPKTITSFGIRASDETLSIYSCAWSPDMKKLLLPVLGEDGLNICIVDIKARKKSYISLGKASALPVISHNGKQVAYFAPSRDGDGEDLVVAPLKEGANPYPLVEKATQSLGDIKFHLLSWSPDDKKMAFVTAKDPEVNPSDLWIIDVSTKERVQIAHHPEGCWAPAWSPNGKNIAYVVGKGKDEDATDIVIIESDRGRVKKTIGDHEINWGPTWSPDGKWLAFRTTMKETVQLSLVKTMKSDGSEPPRFIVLDDFDQLTLAGYYWNKAESIKKNNPVTAKKMYNRAKAEFLKMLKDYPKSIYKEDALNALRRIEEGKAQK